MCGRWPTLSQEPLDVLIRKAAAGAARPQSASDLDNPPSPSSVTPFAFSPARDDRACWIVHIPPEITELMFSYLGSTDLLACSQVSYLLVEVF